MAPKQFHSEDIAQLEQRFRTNLINSCGGFRQPMLVGTIDEACQTNLALFTSIFHVGAHPPMLGMVVRPDSVARHTLENIRNTRCYTLNTVNKDIYQQAHQTSARYPKEVSEFDATGLTPKYNTNFLAPFVLESPLKLGMKLIQTIPLVVNGTILVIGEIMYLECEETLLDADGYIHHEATETIAVAGLDAYYTTELINRLPYAKP